MLAAVLIARALSQDAAGPSGRRLDEVDSDDIEVVYSENLSGHVDT